MSNLRSSTLTPANFPSLVVGVPTGATPAEVTTAFARRSRLIRSTDNPIFSIEDLTAALAELEKGNSDEAELRYSLPADKTVYDRESSFELDGIRYSSTNNLAGLDLASLSDSQRSTASIALLTASIDAALAWEWSRSSELAKMCLQTSRSETERDEALNVLAVCLAFQGDEIRALDALKKAVEGEWNLPLQTNLAILAVEHEPERAVTQMKFLIEGSTNHKARTQAVLTAINLWTQHQKVQVGSDDDEEHEPLPPDVVQAIFEVLTDKDIQEGTFHTVGLFLARTVPEQLLRSTVFSVGPHATSIAAALIRKRTDGFGEYLDELVSQSSTLSRSNYEWLHRELDTHVSAISSLLFGDDVSEFAVGFAFHLLRQGLDCSNSSRLILRLRLIQTLGMNFFQEGAMPSDDFLRWLEEAYEEIRRSSSNFEDGLNDFIIEMGTAASNILGALIHDALVETFNSSLMAVARVQQQMGGLFSRLTANKLAVRSVASAVVRFVDDNLPIIQRILPFVEGPDLRAALQQLADGMKRSKSEMAKYT